MADDTLVLLLTHRGDFFTIDRVQAAVARRGVEALRVDTDRFPAELSLSVRAQQGTVQGVLHADGRAVDLSRVGAVWMRRLWTASGLDGLAPRWRGIASHHARVAMTQLLPLLDGAGWLDRIDLQLAAESKPRQLIEAARVGMTVPDTLFSNHPGEVRGFAAQQESAVVTKLMTPISYDMKGGRGDFMYTSRVSSDDLQQAEDLRWVPQIFQPEIPKGRELRVVLVGDQCFAGAIDTRGTTRGEVDWRRLRADEGPPWEHATVPDALRAQARQLLDRLGLSFGVMDFIVTPEGEHVFLELNPAGEWGWLERDLELPIADAIGQWLVDATGQPERAPSEARVLEPVEVVPRPAAEARATLPGVTTEPAETPRQAPAVVTADSSKPTVLIITHSGDNECIETVSAAIEQRGGVPIRMNTDRYPQEVGLSTVRSRGGTGLVVVDGKGYALESLQAVWYRRFAAGGGLPRSMGDTREAAVGETRRTLFGTIANLECFQLDRLASVTRTHHKELQLRLASEVGLEVPRTLVTNRAEDARDFWRRLEGRVVTKMQHSFAIYREGRENVVYTTRVKEQDLQELDGLSLCPMTFQEELTKVVELRVTVAGTKVMSASIDSARRAQTEVDWRRDGLGLINDWQPYSLPKDVETGLLALQRKLGLNYGAADFIVTPDGRHVFLEVNPVGEFFWLDRDPGLPISDTLAAVLLDQAERNVDCRGG
ncbi:MAG: MvdC/MvdD family ATP grasp protein [Myxococcota bacterium]